MHYITKTTLFKTFLRPILHYGIENIKMNLTAKRKIQTIEANIIKNINNMPRTFKTTYLINAMNIEAVENKINVSKLSFIKRLLKNKLSREIIENKLKDKKKEQNHSLVQEIIEILNIKNETTTLDLKALGVQKLKILKKEKKENKIGRIQDSIRTCLNYPTTTNIEILHKILRSY
jgi:hypothetical protein